MSKDASNLAATVGFPLVILAILMVVNGQQNGGEAVWKGYRMGLAILGGFMPSILLAMLIAGQMNIMIEALSHRVTEFLGGTHGIWGAFGIGIVIPNMSGYTEVEKFWNAADLPLKVVLAGFFVSSRMLNLQTSIFFLPMLGPRLSLIMFGICLVIGIAVVLVLQLLSLAMRA
jgi:hypothetical protein